MRVKTIFRHFQNKKILPSSLQIRRLEGLYDDKDESITVHEDEWVHEYIYSDISSVDRPNIIIWSHHHPQAPTQYEPEDTHKPINSFIPKEVTNNPLRKHHHIIINNTQGQAKIDCRVAHVVNRQTVTCHRTINTGTQWKPVSGIPDPTYRSCHIAYNDQAAHHNNIFEL